MIPIAIDIPHTMEMVNVSESRTPVVGRKEVTTRSFATVVFSKTDEELSMTVRPCAVVVDGGQVSFADSFVKNLPVTTAKVTLVDGVFRADLGVSWTGVKAGSASVPTDADDPTVVDSDRDGHPGMTSYVKLPMIGEVRMYTASIAHTVLSGTVSETGISGGLKTVRYEQETLGASWKVLAVSPSITPMQEKQSFRMVADPQMRCQAAFK